MRTVEDLGEKKVIAIIRDCLDSMPEMLMPFGDDVSAIRLDGGRVAVVKTDMLVGRTDVPQGMNMRQAARKAVVMNISDFAAKGATPLIVLASLGLPRSFTEEDVRQIGRGLNEGAREYGAYVVGGDTNEASDVIISCSLLGTCGKYGIVKRSEAKPGDVVAVTGHFGKTAAGLKILLEGLTVPEKIRKPLTEAVLMPKARLREGLALAGTGALTASIDSSDGLAWSLYELSDASNVGFIVDDIPIVPDVSEFAEKYGFDPYGLCLYGGEEYELVMTIKPRLWEKARKAVEATGTPLTAIGVATKEKKIELEAGGETKPIERKGWEHFRT
jgi:thiamine-monophosphate kinase